MFRVLRDKVFEELRVYLDLQGFQEYLEQLDLFENIKSLLLESVVVMRV